MSPYHLGWNAVVSFSGGRTSAYMLHEIIAAHGGRLPDGVAVVFANTGKERTETLDFVQECASRWGVRVTWLEWRQREKPCFVEVSHNSASRNGEPFAELIRRRKMLPNAVMRFCTEEMKVRVIREYCQSLGWETWQNVVGLRYDEGHRVMKALARNDTGKQPNVTVMPLSKAKVTKQDVMDFWRSQPFDLKLKPHEGNCDLCFLKRKATIRELVREEPARADWWVAQEQACSGRFVTEFSYTDLLGAVHESPMLPFLDEDYDAECGLWCAAQ